MPPKRTSQARAKPSTVSKQKKRRTSMNLEAVSPALSPDVLETITAKVTQRVTATIRDELTTLINNINSASNCQGSISINPRGATNNKDNDELVRESRHLDNAFQLSVVAVVVDHTEKNWCLLSKDKQKKGKFSLQVEDDDSTGKLTIHQVENGFQSKLYAKRCMFPVPFREALFSMLVLSLPTQML
uniref:Uncharacterized protein n=1 Tax=Magallana gigas TaxID=29159 RepID=A0A8W8JNP6_MAGGI